MLHVCPIHKQNEEKKKSSTLPHNGTFLPLKMLISHSLKCPYLHYKPSCKLSEKEWGSKREIQPSVLHPSEMFSSRKLCLPRSAEQDICYKNAALHSDFTFSFSVTFRCWLWSWKDRSPEEYVSVVLQKIRVIPTEQPYLFKKSLFHWLCWAVWYTQQISQPHRITRSSHNNQCFPICLTHCEQESLQYNRDKVR